MIVENVIYSNTFYKKIRLMHFANPLVHHANDQMTKSQKKKHHKSRTPPDQEEAIRNPQLGYFLLTDRVLISPWGIFLCEKWSNRCSSLASVSHYPSTLGVRRYPPLVRLGTSFAGCYMSVSGSPNKISLALMKTEKKLSRELRCRKKANV